MANASQWEFLSQTPICLSHESRLKILYKNSTWISSLPFRRPLPTAKNQFRPPLKKIGSKKDYALPFSHKSPPTKKEYWGGEGSYKREVNWNNQVMINLETPMKASSAWSYGTKGMLWTYLCYILPRDDKKKGEKDYTSVQQLSPNRTWTS